MFLYQAVFQECKLSFNTIYYSIIKLIIINIRPLLVTLVPLEHIKVLQQCNDSKTPKLIFFSESRTEVKSEKGKLAKKSIHNNLKH